MRAVRYPEGDWALPPHVAFVCCDERLIAVAAHAPGELPKASRQLATDSTGRAAKAASHLRRESMKMTTSATIARIHSPESR